MKLFGNIERNNDGDAIKFTRSITWIILALIVILEIILLVYTPSSLRIYTTAVLSVLTMLVIWKHFLQIEPDKIGAVFFLNTRLIILKSGGTYFISPFCKIILGDTSIITITMDPEIDNCWTITTATPAEADIERHVREELSEDQRTDTALIKQKVTALETRLKDDPDHTDVPLRPPASVQLQIVPEEFIYFLKNVPGNTYEEKIAWVKEQVVIFTRRCLEQGFKFRTYAMVKMAMTTNAFNDSLKIHIEKLIDAKNFDSSVREDEEKKEAKGARPQRLGFDCVKANVIGAGSSQKIKDSSENVAIQKRNAEAEKITKKGLADGVIETARGENERIIKISEANKIDTVNKGLAMKSYLENEGIGLALQAQKYFKAIKDNGGDVTKIASLQLELEARQKMIEKSGTIYFTDSHIGNNSDTTKEKYPREAYLILAELKKIAENLKTQGVGTGTDEPKKNISGKTTRKKEATK